MTLASPDPGMESVEEIFFEEAAELLADYEAALLVLEESPGDVELLNRIFRAAHTIKGNAGMLGFDHVAHFTHALESLLDALRTGTRPVTADVVDALLRAGDALRFILRAEQTGQADADDTALTAVLARLHALLAGAPAAPAAETEPHVAAPSHDASATSSASIRVPIAKVDRLINLVGELVITQSMVAQAAGTMLGERNTALAQAVTDLERHARELHEHVLAIRMIPVRTLFARFPRLVRDAAATLGKEVALEVSGEDTELDRTVIERISDPLTHLVRNAVDHGIEPAAERATTGKPAQGLIRLVARQQGGSIYIEVSDDGRGLDRARIVAKAVERGLIPATQSLADEQVWALVFHPGFSTAAEVTAVSGRGVGMDVVRRNVEALGGAIAIDTAAGRGTRFCIKLPLTLAIMDGQTLRVGTHEYVVPLVAIRETVRPRPGSVHTIGAGAEVAIVHGQALPILRLLRILGVPEAAEDPTRGLLVVVEHEGRAAALPVDELLGQQQVVIKSLETNFVKVRGVAGATILADGRIALILDVAGLVALADAHGPRLRAVA